MYVLHDSLLHWAHIGKNSVHLFLFVAQQLSGASGTETMSSVIHHTPVPVVLSFKAIVGEYNKAVIVTMGSLIK